MTSSSNGVQHHQSVTEDTAIHALSFAMDVVGSTRANIKLLKEKNKHLLEFAQRTDSQFDAVPSATTNIIDINAVTDWNEVGQMWQKMNEDLAVTKDNIEKMLFTVNCTDQLLQRWLQIFERTIQK